MNFCKLNILLLHSKKKRGKLLSILMKNLKKSIKLIKNWKQGFDLEFLRDQLNDFDNNQIEGKYVPIKLYGIPFDLYLFWSGKRIWRTVISSNCILNTIFEFKLFSGLNEFLSQNFSYGRSNLSEEFNNLQITVKIPFNNQSQHLIAAEN